MTVAGIILAGGRSTRMGTPKADLEWHGSTLLGHAVEIIRRSVDGPIVVVRAPGQALPQVPVDIRIVDDHPADAGPLNALATGLEALDGHADVAVVCGVDTPMLTPAFVAVLMQALTTEVDVTLPRAGDRRHPIPAVVRVAVHPIARALVDDGQRALFALADACRSAEVDEGRLRAADPALASLRNLNHPREYEAARAEPWSGPRDRIRI